MLPEAGENLSAEKHSGIFANPVGHECKKGSAFHQRCACFPDLPDLKYPLLNKKVLPLREPPRNACLMSPHRQFLLFPFSIDDCKGVSARFHQVRKIGHCLDCVIGVSPRCGFPCGASLTQPASMPWSPSEKPERWIRRVQQSHCGSRSTA